MKFSAAAAKRGGSASPLSCQTSTPAPDDGFGFPRRHRLTRSREFHGIIREGKRIRTAHLDVRVLASPFGISRIGIVVPKHHHTAVERNRLKRRLRELVRLDLLPLVRSHAADLAIRARREAYDISFDALRRDIRRIADHFTAPTSEPPAPRETSA